MTGLVLSVFPGIDLLGRAFEEEGFTVVRGPDPLWGGDIHDFHPPAGVFAGVIGGPPCQPFSTARGGSATRQDDLIPEFTRVVLEAESTWWVMEEVPKAPLPRLGPAMHSWLINNRQFGAEQNRVRRISSNLRLCFPETALEHIDKSPCAATSIWKDGRQYGATTRRDYERVRRLQELPDDFELPGFTTKSAVRAVVNGVPLSMGRAIARAVKAAL